MPMNFIIFNPEECRAESLGCYGHPLSPTPNMNRLASEGVRFEHCFAQHTVCSPSRCSFMTGWYPHVRGHRTLWHLLKPDEPNLLKYLKESGYDIMWWGKNDLLARESFPSCVTSARNRSGGTFGKNPFTPDDPRFFSFLCDPYTASVEEHRDFIHVREAIEFIESRPSRPFLIYLPLLLPHPPYSAPLEWHDMVDPSEIPPLRPAGLEGKPLFHELIRRSRRLDMLEEDFFRKIQAVYLGMIGFIDHLLGMLLDALERTGLDKNTAVFLFSDHGDYAGDYGLVEKWPSGMEDVLVRIPLIARVPGAAEGHTVEAPVELFDIMPTILDLAGIQVRHTHFARSLIPQLEGGTGDPDRTVFAEGGYGRHEPHCFEGRDDGDQAGLPSTHIYYPKGEVQQKHPESVCRTVMIRTRRYKLVYRVEDTCELYDLEKDPMELHNVYGEAAYDDVRATMERKLLEWYLQTSDVVPLEEDPRGLPPRR